MTISVVGRSTSCITIVPDIFHSYTKNQGDFSMEILLSFFAIHPSKGSVNLRKLLQVLCLETDKVGLLLVQL